MVVQNNLMALNANRYLGINNSQLGKNLEKLASGFQINRAGDNAAGLAVSEKMRSQINGINQAIRNNEDGISMVQTFEGALTETHKILQRMKTLATQVANGTYDNEVDRAAAQLEFDQLTAELDQIADTDFNGIVALNGGTMADSNAAPDAPDSGTIVYEASEDIDYETRPAYDPDVVSVPNAFTAAARSMIYVSTIALQAGGRSKDNVNFTFSYTVTSGAFGGLDADMNVSALGLGIVDNDGEKLLSISSQAQANFAIDQIDFAINKVSMVRATFGAIQNRLEHKIDNLSVTAENLTAAESRIRDTDMAKEMMEFTKNQILSQASQSMLAQANMLPQSVLSLLQ